MSGRKAFTSSADSVNNQRLKSNSSTDKGSDKVVTNVRSVTVPGQGSAKFFGEKGLEDYQKWILQQIMIRYGMPDIEEEEPQAKKTLSKRSSFDSSPSSVESSSSTRGSLLQSVLSKGDENKTKKPGKVKPKAKWVPDQEVEQCTICGLAFSTFLRRHHCRSCGIIVCRKCSSQSIPLEQFGYLGAERVCDRCYVEYATGQSVKNPEQNSKTEEDYGLSHRFEFTYWVGATCSYCETLILDVSFYMCSECKYLAHKKCCPLVPNTCSNTAVKPMEGRTNLIKYEQKQLERLHTLWCEEGFEKSGVNSSNFAKFYKACLSPEMQNFDNNLLKNVKDNEIYRLFKFIDKSNSGKFGFEEFVLFLSSMQSPQATDQIRLAFALYDTNGDGFLTQQELTEGLRKSIQSNNFFGGVNSGSMLMDFMTDDIFEAADMDSRTGKLTVEDVLSAYQKVPSVLSKFCGL